MRKALSILCLLLFLMACSEEEQVVFEKRQVRKGPPPGKKTVSEPSKVKKEAQAVPKKEYAYDSTGRRDPFVPLVATKAAEPIDEQQRMITPLQSFDLTQLQLLGVIVGLGDPSAMVLAPDKKSYILKIGTKVGPNNGTVTGITSEGVFVEEIYYDYTGDVRKNIQAIKLPEREGVK